MAYRYRYFRYTVTYSGDREQLEAYARRLRRAGYAADNDATSAKWQPGDTCITSYAALQSYSFCTYAGGGANNFEEHQSNEAITRATETL